MTRISAQIINKGPLTNKEAEILRYMCEGLYTTEIAVRLFRSPRTVGKHIENIAHKLEARGSSEIVLIARELGLVAITLNETGNHIAKLMLLVFVCNMFLPPKDMRRPPRTRTNHVRCVRLYRHN
jgi:DNA-binding CsgD family transcriptional regulator